MSFSVAQLEAQKETARQAYTRGNFPGGATAYVSWTRKQDQLIAEARAREAQPTQQQQTAPVQSQSVSQAPAQPQPAPNQSAGLRDLYANGPASKPQNQQMTTQESKPVNANPAGLIGEFAKNPVGITKSFVNAAAPITAKAESPVGQVADVYVGIVGEGVNQASKVQDVFAGRKPAVEGKALLPLDHVPVVREQAAFTPQSSRQELGGTILRTGEAAVVAVALPVAAPAVGVSAGTVVLGEAIGVGLNQVVVGATEKRLLSAEEAVFGAAEGGAFALVGGVSLKAVERAAPRLASEVANPVVRAATRVGVNTGLGATGGFVLSGGNPEAVNQGALFGAGFGLAGEAAGGLNARFDLTTRLSNTVPIPKYGDVKVPVEVPEGVKPVDVNWKGFYLSKGEEAYPVFGRTSSIPKDATIFGHGVSGETLGYSPKSNIEVKTTLKVMEKTGYGSEVIQDVKDVRSLMSSTKNTPSKFVQDILPTKTGTLSEKGVTVFKDYVVKRGQDVDKLYGSFTQRAQVSEGFEYSIKRNGQVKSALRTPNDIDIMLKDASTAKAELFAKNLAGELQAAGEQVRISVDKPTLIEANVGGKWAHAVDIHYKGEPVSDSLSSPTATERVWGIKSSKQVTKIEKLPSQSLASQGLAKANSVLGFKQDRSLGPVSHRAKDIPDFFQVERSLLESKRGGASSNDMAKLNRLAKRFGVSDSALKQEPSLRDEYVFSKPSKNVPSLTVASLTSVPVSRRIKAMSQRQSVSGMSRSVSALSSSKVSDVSSSSLSLGVSSASAQSAIGGYPSVPSPSKYKPEPKIGGYPVYPKKYREYKPEPKIGGYPKYPEKYREYSNSQQNSSFPAFGLGGGFGRSGPKDAVGTKYFQKRHKIKSYSQMLKTFGVGDIGKPLRGVEQSMRKLEKKYKRRTKKR